MRISIALTFFGLLLAGCAMQHPIPPAKTAVRVPVPKHMPFAPGTGAASEYLRGYHDGYEMGYSGTLVSRSYRRGYQLSPELRGWAAGNGDGFLARNQRDLE